MATLREYFDTDFRHTYSTTRAFLLEWRPLEAGVIGLGTTIRIGGTGEIYAMSRPDFQPAFVSLSDLPYISARNWAVKNVLLEVAGHFDPPSLSKFLACFIPSGSDTVKWAVAIIRLADVALTHTVDFVRRRPYSWAESPIESRDAEYRGRLFLYHESELTEEERDVVLSVATQHGVRLHLRGPEYARGREKKEIPLAFICHDSRDKERIALKIAVTLRSSGCAVWYDEFSLKVGDSLRESIEKGLKTVHRCILVITPNFLSNGGWTKAEFNSIFTRELLERRNVVLPIWDEVSAKDVYEYCPSLADRVALQWSLGEEEVTRRLLSALLEVPT